MGEMAESTRLLRSRNRLGNVHTSILLYVSTRTRTLTIAIAIAATSPGIIPTHDIGFFFSAASGTEYGCCRAIYGRVDVRRGLSARGWHAMRAMRGLIPGAFPPHAIPGWQSAPRPALHGTSTA
jgi:hypothetical protein